MNTMLKRIISLVLCFVLATSYLPVSAFATETGETVATETTEVTTAPTEAAAEETEASAETTEPSAETTEPTNAATEPSVEVTEPEVIAVTGITLDRTAVEVGVGELPMTLTATVLPENASDKTVTWTSSEPGVASVVDGILSFGYMGSATITATAGEFSASCTVTVGEGEWSGYDGGKIVVIAGSDYQLSNSGTIMTNIMNHIREEHGAAYGVLMGGDYDGGAVNTTASHIEIVDDTISGVFSEIASENRVYIQGNHENHGGMKPDGTNLLTTEHVRDTEHYGVYAINHDDFPWTSSNNPSPSEALAKQTAEDLGKYLEAKKAAGYSKPIFVLSHLPLHATTRGDNRYAKLIFDQLEAAGESGLNIIFLVGHNHSGGYDQYLGNGSFYLPKGSSLTVVEGTSRKYTDSSISFTYMNYGYLGRMAGSACTHNTMTAFVIDDDQVLVKRYAADGAHKLKAAGVAVSGYNTDTSVIGTEGATITLTTPTVEEVVEKTHNNITVAAPGLTGLTVEKKFGTESSTGYDKETYAAYASYEISPVGYEQGKYATVTITLNEVDGFDPSRKVVVIDVEKNTETETSITSGKVTFTTDHFSTYDIGQKAIPAADDGEPASGNVYMLVDTMVDGGEYLIVSTNADGSAYAMKNPGGSSTGASMGATAVTIEGGKITTDATDIIWKATANGTRFNLTNGADYLEGKSGNVRIFSTQQYSDRGWNYEGNQLKHTGGTNTYVVYFSNNAFAHTYSSTSEKIYIFQRTSESGSGGGGSVTPVVKDWVTITEATEGTPEIPESTTYKYVLDKNGVNAGEKYLILNVNNGDGYALTNNNGNPDSTPVTISSEEIIVENDTNIAWIFSDSTRGTVGNQGKYVYPSNNSLSLEDDGTDLTIDNRGEGVYRITIRSGRTTYYLKYTGNQWTGASGNSNRNVYLFVYDSPITTPGTPAVPGTPGLYAKIVEADGTDDFTFTVPYGADSNTALGIVKAGIDVLTSASKDGSNPTTLEDTDSKIEWTLATNYEGTVAGEYAVTIKYDGKILGTAKVVVPNVGVEADDILYFVDDAKTTQINATLVDGTPIGGTYTYEVVEDGDAIISSIAADGTITFTGTEGTAQVKVTYTYTEGETTAVLEKTINVTVKTPYVTIELCNPVTDDQGNTSYVPIEKPVALKGVKTGDAYSVWAVIKEYNAEHPNGVDLGDLEDDALAWSVSDTSIATIDTATGDITFTGENYGTFQVMVYYLDAEKNPVCSDTITISASASQYVVPGDGTNDFPEYPNPGAIRFDKTATAVGNYSETGIAKVELSMTGFPYGTSVPTDVVIMMDMTTSMYHYGYIDDADAAIKNMLEALVYDAENNKYDPNIYVQVWSFKSDDDGEDVAFVENLSRRNITTPEELAAAKNAIAFDTDGNDGSGTCYDEGTKKLHEIVNSCTTENVVAVFASDGGPSRYTYLDGESPNEISGTNASVGQDTWFNSDGSVTADYLTEYYTYKLKTENIPVYTIGVGIDADTPEAHVLEHMSSEYDASGKVVSTAPANATTSYFATADINTTPDVLSTVFTGIAASIREAATDVVVEDKIGNNYTLNFSIPTGVSADATDGLTEFYIQAVEYQLNANQERTGEPTVLENFTFHASGILKSHTVNGVACADCNHVTTFTNKITGINGTYFDYTCAPLLDDEGNEVKNINGDTITEEFLTWEAEKITTTELALQYFAHLDGSTGAHAGSMPAGTYYTNEYATLTYKNHLGNEVQQEFPIPQMTWNGAQVSYVFYLVNEAGQPVNRAGRVVPFAEAVFVTDVYTYSVVWQGLEQSAGLEAKYLADKLVPDVYALYDEGAEYKIHVYEDEDGVNLNNHFVIESGLDKYTTYVFNNKSDTVKYSAEGTYIANDKGNTYLCKGEGTVTSTVAEATDVTASNFAESAYYIKNSDGSYKLAELYAEGTTYYAITEASYTAVSGEEHVNASELVSTTGGTVIGGKVYYMNSDGTVYTIVRKSNGTGVYKGFDFSNTTVAFAVVWKPELVADTVVVDFGLDVIIDVITNDNMAAGVVGVRTDKPNAEINKGRYTAAKAHNVDVYIDTNNDADGQKELKIGTAKVENLNSVRFSLDKTNGMQFTDSAVFYYETDVNFYDTEGNLQTTSMYSSVTVIPATTIYYEDEYVALNTYRLTFTEVAADAEFVEATTYYTKNENGTYVKQTGLTEFAADTTYYTASANYEKTTGWDTNSVKATATQQQDRPGESKISAALDADNKYGYDAAYKTMITHSMGSAAKVHVDANSYATAEFTFYGTGFDVISMTSNTTGTLLVRVYDAAGTRVRNTVVDTYYGMDAEGNISINSPEEIYQVPVIKIFDLPYGKYTVTITATYGEFFDHNTAADGYDLYLDAIRIYDPTGDLDETANEAYKEDGEANAVYEELRDNIIAASEYKVTENEDGTVTVTGNDLSGAIFIDCNDENTSIKDYVSYGPNNELYLDEGQAIAFAVTATETMADVQLGIKVANGGSVSYKINGDSYTINTTTDMYYSIWEYVKDGGVVTIENVDGGILSLTNIKYTFKAETSTNGLLRMTAEDAGTALRMLRRAPVVEEEIPETTVPEVTEPEITEPEATEPEVTEPAEPDNSELRSAVEAVKKLKENDYTKDSYKAVKSALKAAEKVLRDKKATQSEIDEALAALNEAVEDLETKTYATKPGKNEKPGKENQNKPNSNTGNTTNKQQNKDVIAQIATMLFGWLFK